MVEKCIVCNGTGRSVTPPDFPKCTACGGTGKVFVSTCSVCGGSGGKIPDGFGNTRRVRCFACNGMGYHKSGISTR